MRRDDAVERLDNQHDHAVGLDDDVGGRIDDGTRTRRRIDASAWCARTAAWLQDWADRLMATLAPFEMTRTFRPTLDPLALAEDRHGVGAFAGFRAATVDRDAVA